MKGRKTATEAPKTHDSHLQLWCNTALKIERNYYVDVDNPKTEKPQFIPFVLSPTAGGEQFPIASETLIGREIECTVALNSPHVSRYHAKIVVDPSGPMIEDLNSANGTFVNGKRIKEKTRLSIGDEIKFDDLVFRLTTQSSGTSDATVLSVRPIKNPEKPEIDSTKPAALEKSAPVPSDKETPSTDKEAAQTAKAGVNLGSDDDNTRMLNTDQINRIASMNKRYQHITDKGSGPRLIATTAPIRGKLYPLKSGHSNQNTWTVGRAKDTNICVSDPSVSRHHATIEKKDGRYVMNAEASAKPVLFNDQALDVTTLKHNDTIQLGHVEFIFRLDEQDTSPAQEDSQTEPEQEQEQKNYGTSPLYYVITGGILALVVFFGTVFLLK